MFIASKAWKIENRNMDTVFFILKHIYIVKFLNNIFLLQEICLFLAKE